MQPIDTASPQGDALNMRVAVTVAILATFMGICKVKDDNICQAMQQVQANRVDHWAYYQARNIREEIARSTIVELRLAALGRPPQEQQAYREAMDNYQHIADEQKLKKDEAKGQAEQDQKEYDAANFKDDQFDLSDAALAIAIALLAMTALTGQRWLFAVSMIPVGFGILMGLSGLFGWTLHPSALVAMLS